MDNTIIVFTDGSGINRKDREDSGHGGCGVVMKQADLRAEHSFGCFINTTSARMEIFGIIKALDLISPGFNIHVFTDNQYCKNTIMHKWYDRWISTFQDKANMDLWKRFKDLHDTHIKGGSQIQITWVRGHDGNEENEIADRLAYSGRKNCKQIIDDRNGIYAI